MVKFCHVLSGALVAVEVAWGVATVKRHASELLDSYDFVVAGGGTTGLTVADRLSEAFPEKTVLVVEYGDMEYAPGVWDPPKVRWEESGGMASSWTLSSTPSPALNNATAFVMVGKVVGGSSAVNGMFFDRGSRHDYDAWDRLQDDGRTGGRERWNWDAIYPFFRKSATFTPPSPEVAAKYGYTWNASFFGMTTPIYASFPPFLWADADFVRQAWLGMGVRKAVDCAGGDKEGVCWIPNSQHPVTGRRSYAGLGHYALVAEERPNYHLLVRHQAVRVVYRDGDVRSGPPTLEIRSVDNGTVASVRVGREVILSAGAFGSPSILLRSGIGPAEYLDAAGIPLVLDLPGVGSNLQDHSGPPLNWNYTTPLDLHPLPSDMLNATFAAAALRDFNATPATGPYTVAMSNTAIFVPLPNVSIEYSPILDRIRDLASLPAAAGPADLYLPPSYASSPTLLAGYRAQLLAIADLLANPRSPSLESAITTGSSIVAVHLHPLSRGTVRLNGADPLGLPILDYRSASNPVDLDLHIAHFSYLRRTVQSEVLKGLGAVEIGLRADASQEEVLNYVKANTVQSYMHPCCTSAMLPLSRGGVVGVDLRVHGVEGLRVADMSVLPIHLGSHLSATAYAVGEKAADIIIRYWSKKGKRKGKGKL